MDGIVGNLAYLSQ